MDRHINKNKNIPQCPKCGSNDIWDDNTWEGCNHCDYLKEGMQLVRASDNRVLSEHHNN